MTNAELVSRLDVLADRLVPVAGYLMRVATSNGRCAAEPDIHEPNCPCELCRAFFATQSVTTELTEIIGALTAPLDLLQ